MPFIGLHFPLRGASTTKDCEYRPRDPADMDELFEPAPDTSEFLDELLIGIRGYREFIQGSEFHLIPKMIFDSLYMFTTRFDHAFYAHRKAWENGMVSPSEMNFHRHVLQWKFEIAGIMEGATLNIAEEHELKCLEILKDGTSNFHLLSEEVKQEKTRQIEYLKEKPLNVLFIQKQVQKIRGGDVDYLDRCTPGVMSEELDGDLILQCTLTAEDLVTAETLPIHPIFQLGSREFPYAWGRDTDEAPDPSILFADSPDGILDESHWCQLGNHFRATFTPLCESDHFGCGSFLAALLDDSIPS